MGGCGGLFNALIARELGIQRVLVPELTSVLSAFGAANADIRRERSRSVDLPLPCDPALVEAKLSALAAAVHDDLAADGIGESDRSIRFEGDLRFVRQQSELTVDCSAGFGPPHQNRIIDEFKAEYGRRYGQGALVTGTPVELVTLRTIGLGRTVRAELAINTSNGNPGPVPVVGTRSVYLGAENDALQVKVIAGANLLPGQTLEGPALIDSVDTTIWIPSDVRAVVDAHRTINLEVPR
jgi:N-methylhydantoinase A